MAVVCCVLWRYSSLFLLVYFSMVLTKRDVSLTELDTITLEEVENITKNSCILTFVSHVENFLRYTEVFHKLKVAFEREPKVRIAVLKNTNNDDLLKIINWKDEYPQYVNNSIVFFALQHLDRTCLSLPKTKTTKGEIVQGNLDFLLSYLNLKCQTFQTLDGNLSRRGRKRSDILKNLYRLPKTPTYPVIGSVCERIRMPSKEEFINKYLYTSRPVIIEGALEKWRAPKKWTNRFLKRKFGKNDVHIKLTSDGVFEGCEKAELFSNFKSFHIPDYVAKQLLFGDLVVVRPATMNVNFTSFMDMVSLPKESNISAYLEYSSIPDYMPQLEEDIDELDFVRHVLTRKHLNMWLSNGHTLGKLHFDPFDNFLCQISGTKEITLFEPHSNTFLYEGHIQEAILGFDKKSKTFSRRALLESTSMVMSPVDIVKPDYRRFPRFKEVPAMRCTINEGDVLYMPSFWWHEVQSRPSKEKRNLAVNYWYEPFLIKEFPCAECPMDINPHYYHTLL